MEAKEKKTKVMLRVSLVFLDVRLTPFCWMF